MLRDWPSSRFDFSNVPDLERDPIVMWQHRHYWKLVWLTNLGMVLVLGWLIGDVIGTLLLAGVLRLVVGHHFTFFINSAAHLWGRRPYSDENTAVDNDLLALLTWGEGYHNYHHAFQSDYRNGVRWWQYDPGKWLINGLAWTGLASNLNRTEWFKIERTRLARQFDRLRAQAARPDVEENWRERLEREYLYFRRTVSQWQTMQVERVEAGTDALRNRWDKTRAAGMRRELEYCLKVQRQRLRALAAGILSHR
ncbi:MAG: fatty acid desaturase [Bacteroidales bacterium]